MPAQRRLRHWTHWVTLVALVMAAMVPTLTRAWVHLQGDASAEWGQVCAVMAATGMEGSGQPGGNPATAGAHDHCALCLLPADHGAPPQLAAAEPLRADLAHALPALYLAAPHTLFAWSAALARAPPSLA